MDLDVPLYETVKRIPTAIDVNLAAAAAAVANVGMTGGRSNTPDVITITTDQGLAKQLQNPNLASMNASNMGGSAAALSQSMAAAAAAAVAASNKKRKRHIAIDVETERAKLHALLNNTQNPGTFFLSNSFAGIREQRKGKRLFWMFQIELNRFKVVRNSKTFQLNPKLSKSVEKYTSCDPFSLQT